MALLSQSKECFSLPRPGGLKISDGCVLLLQGAGEGGREGVWGCRRCNPLRFYHQGLYAMSKVNC